MSLTLNVFSIFFSVSGEIGLWPQGMPVVFVRLAGCNLRCSYCDTPKSLEASPNGEDSMRVFDIVQEVEKFSCKRVLITGGEPLMQNVTPLLQMLKNKGFEICIETNGSIPFKKYSKELVDRLIVDIKLPSSNMAKRMMPAIEYAQDNVQLKLVCKDRGDFLVVKSINKAVYKANPMALSACLPLTSNVLFDWMKEEGMTDCILNVQLHKLIGLKEEI